jgi:hypothetical protein
MTLRDGSNAIAKDKEPTQSKTKAKGTSRPAEYQVPEHKKELKRVSMKLIDPDPLNPKPRTEDPAIQRLLDDARQNGLHAPVHVILHTGRYLLVDGHRRRRVAELLEYTHMECVVHHLSDKYRGALWCVLSIQRAIKAIDWMEVWYESDGKRPPPAKHLGHINACQRIFGGRTGIKYLLDHKVSPTVCQVIDSMCMHFTRSTATEPPTPKELGMWTVENGMQSVLQALLVVHPNVQVLRKVGTAVRLGKPTSMAKLYPEKKPKKKKEGEDSE